MQVGLARELRLAFTISILGGFLLGTREALITLGANAFVQPDRYSWLLLGDSIGLWLLLAGILLVPCAGTVAAVRRGTPSRRRTAPTSVGLYAALLAVAGALSIALPWVNSILDRWAEVGMVAGKGLEIALWVFATGMVVGASALVGGAAIRYANVIERLSAAAFVAAPVIALVILWPVGRFFASNWKWIPPPIGETPEIQMALPNVLLISADALRADHLGCYGNERGLTPNLDRLASEGVLFEQAITASPWTLPAIASLLTGLYPSHHRAGMITNRRDPMGRSALASGSWTISEALRSEGYRTHAVVTNPYLALRYGLGEGFETYENVTVESESFLALSHTTMARLIGWLFPGVIVGDRGETVSSRAESWLARLDRGRPFFLWLHYIDPHPPYARRGFVRHKTFRTDTLLERDRDDLGDLPTISPSIARLRSGEIRLSPEQKEMVRELYREEVMAVDAAVGAVLDALDRLALADGTLVVFVADHGEEFWDHGGVEHGHTVYEELLRVPLIMRWPRHLPESTRLPDVVRTLDIPTTILELLGLSVPERLDGKSLLSIVGGQASTPRLALAENMLFTEERVGMRIRDYKYVRWENGKEELYQLASDPRELRNLAGLEEKVRPLRELWAAIAVEADVEAPPTQTPPRIDSRTEAAMRALGYIR